MNIIEWSIKKILIHDELNTRLSWNSIHVFETNNPMMQRIILDLWLGEKRIQGSFSY